MKSPHGQSRRGFSTELAAAAFAASGAAALWGARGADPDLFARIAVGRELTRRGFAVFEADPFSYTARPGPWIDHEWLSGKVFYALTFLGADTALWWFKWAMYFAFLMFVAEAGKNGEGKASPLGLFVAGAGTLYLWVSTVRAQIFTYTFLAFFLFLFRSLPAPARGARLLFFPAVMIFWANLHGGWVLGAVFLGLFTVFRLFAGGKSETPLALVSGATFAAALLNPWGVKYWSFLGAALSMPRPRIPEWESVSPVSPIGVLMLLVIFAVYLLRDRSKSLFRFENAILLASAVFGFLHLRFSGIFFLTAGTLYETELSRLRASLRNVLSWAAVSSACAGAVFFGIRAAEGFPGLDYSFYPVRSCDFLLKSEYSGRLLLPFNAGSYALYRLYPKFRVSLDGRYEEVYTQTTVDAVRCAFTPTCRDRDAALKMLDPDCVLAPENIVSNFGPELEEVFSEPGFRVFCRHSGALGDRLAL